MERDEELIAGYADGGLTEGELRELAELAQTDAAVRHRLSAHAEIAGLLAAHLTPQGARDDLVRRTMLCLPQDGEARPTVAGVMAKLSTVTPRDATADPLQKLRPRRWVLIAALGAAALVALMAGAAGWFWYHRDDFNFGGLMALATVERINGNVFLLTPHSEARERAGTQRPLNSREGIEIDPGGSVDLKYADGTTLGLSAGAAAARMWMRDASTAKEKKGTLGKRVLLEAGALSVNAAAQPAERPFILTTPHAEAEVVGTRFKLTVTMTETRLEVFAGCVKFTDLNSGRSAPVNGGNYAVTAGGGVNVLPLNPAE